MQKEYHVAMTQSQPFETGQAIQEYRLKQLRGKGSFGIVWEAENEKGEPRALKFLPVAPDDPCIRQEIRAIQMIAQLEHPNLMPVEKVMSLPKWYIIAMRLADGSLQDLFDAYQSEYHSGIEPAEVCRYLTQAATALDFLNTQKHHLGSWPVGIQHGDVKPSNLLLFGEMVLLSDFNLASPTSRALQFGTRLGTPGYVAPEVYYGRFTNATDQYSLAVTYCYLRGGKMPFIEKAPEPGQSYPGLRPPPDLSMLNVDERPILTKALALMPRDRWKTCDEMMQQLIALAQGRK
jgi:serine/threonine protein kinase